MADARPISLWDSTASEQEVRAVPLPEENIDVAVVGGGFTGLSTALHCARKGCSVHVIEAERIGHGGSGRNVGMVNPGTWLQPSKVCELLGSEYGPRFMDLFSRAPKVVFDIIERHQIRCEATGNGTIHAAHSRRGMADLEKRFAYWSQFGQPVTLLDRAEVERLTGTRSYHGGLLDQRAGTINPMAYCRGLARAAADAGAGITTGVRATKLRPSGKGWQVETERGIVAAQSVVLGTNAYSDELWPGLSKIFSRINYLQLASEPMGDEAESILPGRQGLWDTGLIMFNFRRDQFNRILIGTMGRVHGSKDSGLTRRWAEARTKRVFPQLGPLRFEVAWHGQIAMTADHLPRLLRLADGLWAPIGYNGRGITTGTVFGMTMADILTGADQDKLPLPPTRMTEYPRASLWETIHDAAFTACQAWGSIR